MVKIGFSMITSARLLLELWPYGFKITMFLINRLPFHTLDNKSPFKVLCMTQPDYSCLRIFGCLYYPYTTRMFLGYPEYQKVFNCYDPITRRMYVFAHIVFDETEFPYLTFVQIPSSSNNITTPTSKQMPMHLVRLSQSQDESRVIYNVIQNPSNNVSIIQKYKALFILV